VCFMCFLLRALCCAAGYKVCMAVRLRMEDWPIGGLPGAERYPTIRIMTAHTFHSYISSTGVIVNIIHLHCLWRCNEPSKLANSN
jgi:hypothetical protein